MWGKVKQVMEGPVVNRIIPTGVRKRVMVLLPCSAPSDHPHGCGEKLIRALFLFWETGSSPRVWGKGRQCRYQRRYVRIIPTGVGKRERTSQAVPMKTDHPHGCGEKGGPVRMWGMYRGSSPRVWGKVLICLRPERMRRIIPTGVGKSV